MKEHYGCPIKATANTLAGKWKVMVVWHLSFGTLRFAELTGVRPMIEVYPLEKADEAYARMISGKAQFRVVLKM